MTVMTVMTWMLMLVISMMLWSSWPSAVLVVVHGRQALAASAMPWPSRGRVVVYGRYALALLTARLASRACFGVVAGRTTYVQETDFVHSRQLSWPCAPRGPPFS
jgi:hypothetical protein